MINVGKLGWGRVGAVVRWGVAWWIFFEFFVAVSYYYYIMDEG
jgi:hypothetical protein